MKCAKCGGRMTRVHRTFLERFGYMAIYECHRCECEECVPRRFRFHLGPHARCPICGTYRVVRLKEADKIDRKHRGFLNFLERIMGKGRMFHCRWCRLQYFDRREVSLEARMRTAVAGRRLMRETEKVAGTAR